VQATIGIASATIGIASATIGIESERPNGAPCPVAEQRMCWQQKTLPQR